MDVDLPRQDDVAEKKPSMKVKVSCLIIDIICCLLTFSMIFLVATNCNVSKMPGKESFGYLQYVPDGEETQFDERIAIVPYGEETSEDFSFFSICSIWKRDH